MRSSSLGPLSWAALLILSATLTCLLSGPSADAATLPRDKPWHTALRDYLASLDADDLRIELRRFDMPADAYEGASDDAVYRDWIALVGNGGRLIGTRPLRIGPEPFLLDAIESDDGIRAWHSPEEVAWWVQFEAPGNPFFDSAPARRRAMVMAAVNMIMLDSAHGLDEWLHEGDYIAENLMAWAYAYLHAGDVLPPPVRDAFEQGLIENLAKMERWSPRDVNTNMDQREIVVLALMSEIFADDSAMQQRLADSARKLLFGSPRRGPDDSDGELGMFHTAGYIGEADGPDASYNGISLYHLLEAAAITRGNDLWDAFFPQTIDRMLDLKLHNAFPDPSGYVTGPSNWSKRTNAPMAHDQRARAWRQIAAAMLSDHGLPLLPSPPPDRQVMIRQIRDTAAGLGVDKPADGDEPAEAPLWVENATDWPADLIYTYDHYVPGSYARFRELAQADSPLLALPFARRGDFNRVYDREFWIVKRDDWGFQIESIADMGWGYPTGGLAGGSLATFWTRDAGPVIVGRMPDKWNKVAWDDIAHWPTHHVWGMTDNGYPFSSARHRHPDVFYDDPENPTHVIVRGPIDDAVGDAPPNALTGRKAFRRDFHLQDDGLRIVTTLSMDRAHPPTQAWETLPIFLRSARGHRDQPDARIEFRIAGQWRTVDAGVHERVEALRLTRFDGAVRIDFTRPGRIRVGEVWDGAYQSSDRIRNLHIDLLESATPTMSGSLGRVEYLIHPEPAQP